MRRSALALAVLLAFPTGGQLRTHLDARGQSYPVHAIAASALVDADPAEQHLQRYVLTTDLPARRLDRHNGIVEAVDVADGQVAIATRLTRRQVAAMDGVDRVEVDALRSVASFDPAFGDLWALHNTGQTIYGTTGLPGADIRWNDLRGHADGAGAVVAVIDSGIDFSHPDLAHAKWTNPGEICDNGLDDDANGYVDDCHGWDFANDDKQQFDTRTAGGSAVDNSHGTHIAGTIAAAADNGVGIAGVAPGVKIMPLKIMENGSFPMSRTARAIDYAVANGADVINASWGGTGMGTAEADAVRNAGANGVLFVAAAGNKGTNNDTSPFYPASLDAPAVVAVAASTSLDQTASFSCYGRTSVDLHAPGSMILSTMPGGGLAYMNGTSMAAPHVAAVAALLRSRTPDMAMADVRSTILGSVDRLDTLAGMTVTGGRLDAASALGIGEGGTRFVFNDFDTFAPGEAHTAQVVVQAPTGALPSGAAVVVNASLGVVDSGAVRGVLDHPINDGATDAEAQIPLTSEPLSPTDRVNLAGPGIVLPVTTALPPGDYALLVELVNDDEPDKPVIGEPGVVLFSIDGPGGPEPSPSASPTPAAPVPDEPVPADPDPDTTSPAPGTGPDTTSPPPGTDPGTPAPGTGPPPPAHAEPGPGQPAPPQPEAPPPPPASDPDPDTGTPAPTNPKAPNDPHQPDPEQPGPEPPAPEPPAAEPPPAPGDDDPYIPIAPPPDVPAPTVPGDEPVPLPVDDWRVHPNAGSTAGGEYVRIDGNFPDGAYVRFGDSNGPVASQDDHGMTVKTPAHLPGTVDVTIIGRTGAKIVLPGAYTFIGDAPPPPPVSTDPGDPEDPATQPPPAPDSPDDPGTQPPDDTIAPPGDDAPVTTVKRTLGRPYVTAAGLRVDSFRHGHPLGRLSPTLWDAHACRAASCAGLIL